MSRCIEIGGMQGRFPVIAAFRPGSWPYSIPELFARPLYIPAVQSFQAASRRVGTGGHAQIEGSIAGMSHRLNKGGSNLEIILDIMSSIGIEIK